MFGNNDYRDYLCHNNEDLKYGLPEKKKYPMPDRDHVMSAIKFFNYVSPSDEKELARNILKRIKEYGIEDINVGDKNRFKKYYKPAYLEHSARGQKWSSHKYLYITPNGRYVYPEDQAVRRVENSFKVSKKRRGDYLYINPNGERTPAAARTAKRVQNTFRPLVEDKTKKRKRGRQRSYGMITAPDGSSIVKRVAVAKKQVISNHKKTGNSRVFGNWRDDLIDLKDLKIGGKKKPRTRPNTQRKKYRTSGTGSVNYWTMD